MDGVSRVSHECSEWRNYTFPAEKIAVSNGDALKPVSQAGHSKAVRASHSVAVGGYAISAHLGGW